MVNNPCLLLDPNSLQQVQALHSTSLGEKERREEEQNSVLLGCRSTMLAMISGDNNDCVNQAMVSKVHIQGGSDNAAPFPHNHPYKRKFLLQLYLCIQGWLSGNGAVLSLPPYMYVYFVDQCHPYILLISTKLVLSYL